MLWTLADKNRNQCWFYIYHTLTVPHSHLLMKFLWTEAALVTGFCLAADFSVLSPLLVEHFLLHICVDLNKYIKIKIL